MSVELLRQVARYLDGDRATAGRFALACRDARWTDMPASVLRARLVDPPTEPDYAALVAYGAQHAAFERLSDEPLGQYRFAWADRSALPCVTVHRRADGLLLYGPRGDRLTAVTTDPAIVVADQLRRHVLGAAVVGVGVYAIAARHPTTDGIIAQQCYGWRPVPRGAVLALHGSCRTWLDQTTDAHLYACCAASFDLDEEARSQREADFFEGVEVALRGGGSGCMLTRGAFIVAVERNRASCLFPKRGSCPLCVN